MSMFFAISRPHTSIGRWFSSSSEVSLQSLCFDKIVGVEVIDGSPTPLRLKGKVMKGLQ